ncbi:MAG: SDR family oxidoreductase [Myxococcota bacterium]|nr:SDR family oxidoreductase [Myxococcota bacterium]
MRRAWIQGASRGIGLALASNLVDRGDWHVTTTCRAGRSPALDALVERAPERVQPLAMDLARPESIEAAAEQVEGPLHLLFNVGGFLHEGAQQPEKRFEALDGEALMRSFAVNAVGPILVAKAALPALRKADEAVIANLSARVGSIADNRMGGWYGYRASKAGLNMLTRTLSIELRRRAPSVHCIALHPGTVDTSLSRPFRGGVPMERRFAPEQAAEKLLQIALEQGPRSSGRFLAWDGSEIPW